MRWISVKSRTLFGAGGEKGLIPLQRSNQCFQQLQLTGVQDICWGGGGETNPSAEMQSVYSSVPSANWPWTIRTVINCVFIFHATNVFGYFCSVMAQFEPIKHSRIRLHCVFICMVLKGYMEWNNAQHVNTPSTTILPTTTGTFLSLNCFSHMIYTLQTSHHCHVLPQARISLTLSRHFSLSFIASGRSSELHPISSHSCCMYVRAGRPAFAWPYTGVHRSTSLMSSSLLLQQCPACLVRLTCIVFVMGVRCHIVGALWGVAARTCSILLAKYSKTFESPKYYRILLHLTLVKQIYFWKSFGSFWIHHINNRK